MLTNENGLSINDQIFLLEVSISSFENESYMNGQ